MTDIIADYGHGEQLVLEVRSSAPSNPETHQAWIRDDLTSGDQIGALEFGDGTQVPIYPTSVAVSGSVTKAFQVSIGGQMGFIPTAPVGDASFGGRRFPYNDTNYALHDSTEPVAIPDPVVSLYEFEGSGDDSVGSNDLSISGSGSISSDAAVGQSALSCDGQGEAAQSQSQIDLSAAGETDGFGIPCWIKPTNDSGTEYAAGWANTGDKFVYIRLSGTITSLIEGPDGAGGTESTVVDSGISIDTNAHTHVYVEVDSTNLTVYVDGNEESSSAHGVDVTALGQGYYHAGTNEPNANTPYNGIIDDWAPATDPLTVAELQTLVDRGS